MIIDRFFLINMDQSTDRLAWAQSELRRVDFPWEVERVSGVVAINDTQRARTNACTLAHIKCLELAIERQYQILGILEDDLEFTESWDRELLNYLELLEKEPWDICKFFNMGNAVERLALLRGKSGYCTHFYLIKKRVFPILLETYRRLVIASDGRCVDNADEELLNAGVLLCTTGHQLVVQNVTNFGSIRLKSPKYAPPQGHSLWRIMK